MRFSRLALATLPALALAGHVHAAEVTASGADEMQRMLTRYLPADLVQAGLVTVRAASSFYELRFDPAVLLSKADPRALTVTGLKPLTTYVRPMEGGLYSLEQTDRLDIKGTFSAGTESASFTYLIDTMKMTGIFDPSIPYFQSADWTAKGARVSSISPAQTVDASIGEMAMRLSSVKTGAETLDITSTGVFKAFVETISHAQTGKVDISADTVDIDVSMDGARYRAFQDLVSFVLANMNKQTLNAADAAHLKDMLRSSLPVFDNLLETITARNVSVGTPQGRFGARQVAYTIDMNGIANSTRVGFGFSLDDPQPPAGVLPAELLVAVPRSASFKAAVTNLNLAGAANYLLDNADFTSGRPLSDEQGKEIGRIILPGGAMTVEFEDVAAVSEIYDVHLTGKMTVYPEQKGRQSTEVSIVARDFDKTVAFLQKNAATVPQFGQAAFVMLMVKGFAKDQNDGSQRWDVAVGENGKVLINGRPLPFQP